ncbi:biotin/lipoyl-binding protein [Pseudomonas sp. GOM6]|uniref:HlyD family secretion protein n=1 Tax=Pseudomonas sp. GOM6 TaxID=3036944 RepID=UPI00240A3224|nr:biotin/lipoyl-binding protein [Pseudomonas sp. GOM6]MDG1582209.1 biotin/lipoyl-binding protein [Pseudomonas sp. GOM6]
MDLLLLLTYAAICVVIFKVFKIPLNKWSVPTAALGGVVIVGALVFVMNYNHPYSEVTRSYFISVPIVPSVSGQVVEVPIRANQKVKQGDVLFRIDPTPFESKVKSIKAQLVSAKADQYRAATLAQRNLGNRRDLDQANARVDDLQAQLIGAQFNLDSAVVRAPSDGMVLQVFLRPGVRAVKLPLRPAMVFVPDESTFIVAWMRQNSQLRLLVGEEAEVAFDSLPGRVFSAKVRQVLPLIGEGEVQATGNLVSFTGSPPPGRVPVVLDINDPDFDAYREQIPGGAYGQAAIYTQHMHHVAVMRKILLRMASWMNYFFPFH